MNVTLYDKRDFAVVIKWRTVTWGDNFRLSNWTQFNHTGPWSGNVTTEEWSQKRNIVGFEAEVGKEVMRQGIQTASRKSEKAGNIPL